MGRNLTDKDIEALANHILAKPEVLKSIVNSCSGRFVHSEGGKELEQAKKDLLHQARETLKAALQDDLQTYKFDIKNKVASWYKEHYQKVVLSKVSDFFKSTNEARMKEWVLEEIQTEVKNKIRSKVGRTSFHFDLDDIFDF